MSNTVMINATYKVTSGKLKGFTGKCFAADMDTCGLHGAHVLLEIDGVASLFVHPKYIEIVPEPDSIDLRQMLIGGI